MKKKQVKNPKTLQESIGEKFDYFINRLHCRGTNNNKMRYSDMCVACREASYHNKTLKTLKQEIMDFLDNKSL